MYDFIRMVDGSQLIYRSYICTYILSQFFFSIHVYEMKLFEPRNKEFKLTLNKLELWLPFVFSLLYYSFCFHLKKNHSFI